MKKILLTAAMLLCAANLSAQCLGVGSSTSSMSLEEMAQAAQAGIGYVEIGISGCGTVTEIREKALHAKRKADEAGLKERLFANLRSEEHTSELQSPR